MSRLTIYTGALFIALSLFWVWHNTPLGEKVSQYVQNGEILTLEARYTPEQVVGAHTVEILGDRNQRKLKEIRLKFFPYVLMNVKYPQPDRQIREGIILWSLVDGEMVIDTDTWEKTHGFEDAVAQNANPNDFKVMQVLARNRSFMTVNQLQAALGVDSENLASIIDSAKRKHFIIQRGNELQLHFQNPRMLVSPQTRMNESLVTKPYAETDRAENRYSKKQVEKTAYAAFGQDFTIRDIREIFLPVYSIETLNPDGSVLTTYWNAINGKRIKNRLQG